MESQIIPGFHAVEFFRKVKEEISNEIYGLSYEELMEYFARKKREHEESKSKRVEKQ